MLSLPTPTPEDVYRFRHRLRGVMKKFAASDSDSGKLLPLPTPKYFIVFDFISPVNS